MRLFFPKKNSEGFYRICSSAKFTDMNPIPFKIKNKSLIAFKNHSRLYIFQNSCPHQVKELDNAYFENDYFVCRHHNWKFNPENGEALNQLSGKLIRYESKVVDGHLWVKLTYAGSRSVPRKRGSKHYYKLSGLKTYFAHHARRV